MANTTWSALDRCEVASGLKTFTGNRFWSRSVEKMPVNFGPNSSRKTEFKQVEDPKMLKTAGEVSKKMFLAVCARQCSVELKTEQNRANFHIFGLSPGRGLRIEPSRIFVPVFRAK